MNYALIVESMRLKYRYPTTKGVIDTETLFGLSIQSLDRIAVTIHNDIELYSKSFTKSKKKNLPPLEPMLEVVKEIIKFKEGEQVPEKPEEESKNNIIL